ncbi:MAG: hypothetical protein KDD27_01580 [Saprospiraceae bacterium]|nr:hypothetical protein [Saprospiraceae bacterium]
MDREKVKCTFRENLMNMFRFCFLLLLTQAGFAQTGQNDPVYKSLVETAFAHLQNEECKECLNDYEQAFDISKHSALSHLRAAVCAERCGQVEKRDKLIRTATTISWDLCNDLLDDADRYVEFKPYIGTPFEKMVRLFARQQAEANGVNFDLKAELERIHYLDQKYRIMKDSMKYEHKKESPEYEAFIQEWIHTDSLNMVRIEEIFAQHGFPGKSMVGDKGASTVWLVIQHAPLEKQEQYFPMLTKAAEEGEMDKSDWAYLLDRINMRNKRPQVYGSQITSDPVTGYWIFYEIEDEINVNKRRAEVGLGPLEKYAQMMGVDWKLPTTSIPPSKDN